MTHKLMSSQISNPLKRDHPAAYEAYLTALRLYWGGLYQEASAYLSKMIAQEPKQSNEASMYRLWIECMAMRQDEPSLNVLSKHLLLRATEAETSEEKALWHALKGLCHIELDEIDAARLELSCLSEFNEVSYVSELKQVLWSRASEKGKMPLLDFNGPIYDYVTWNTLIKSLVAKNDLRRLTGIVNYVDQVFSGAPVKIELEFHEHYANKNLKEAEIAAATLVQCYPDRAEFCYFLAMTQLERGHAKRSMVNFEKTIEIEGEHPDTLIGLARALQVQSDYEPDFVEDAILVYQRAIKFRKEANLPYTDIAFQIEKLKESNRQLNNDPILNDDTQLTQSWFLQLDVKDIFRMQTANDDEIDLIFKSLGEDARPGDLVFVAGENKKHIEPGWRIYAIYVVSSEVCHHPILGEESALQLIVRPELPIPLDIVVVDEDEGVDPSQSLQENTNHKGVFCLEAGALDLINEAIKQQNQNYSDLDISDKLTKFGWIS